jgi:hypothetical protein
MIRSSEILNQKGEKANGCCAKRKKALNFPFSTYFIGILGLLIFADRRK